MVDKYPKVSVIIPCRNEEKFIGKVIESLLKQTYPKDKLEILFIDGMSEDKTNEIIEYYSQKHPFIKLFKNPYKYVPHAMNIGIKNASGDIIIRMDAHSEYPSDYVEKLIYWKEKLGADNVGAICITLPQDNSIKGRAIALALSHPFGVGNSLFRIQKDLKEPIEVDTVPFGCYSRDIFDKIGFFDEDLIRNQDDEFNARLIKAGGKIFLIPEITIKYYARNSLKKVAKMFYQYGYFKPLVNLKIGKPTTLRQLIPPLFVFILLFPLLLFLIEPKVYIISFLILLLYSLVDTFFSLKIAIKEKNILLFSYLFTTFFIIHLSYGIGYWKGIIDFIFLRKHKKDKLDVSLSR